MGRPSDYNDQTIPKTLDYITKCEDEVYVFQKLEGRTNGFEEKVKTHLPSIAGLALHLGISRETVYQWEKEHAEFSDTITRIRAMQEQSLLDGGLSGRYNPLIAKLVLSSNHGYREGKDITTDGKAVQIPIYGGLSVQGHDSDQKDIPA